MAAPFSLSSWHGSTKPCGRTCRRLSPGLVSHRDNRGETFLRSRSPEGGQRRQRSHQYFSTIRNPRRHRGKPGGHRKGGLGRVSMFAFRCGGGGIPFPGPANASRAFENCRGPAGGSRSCIPRIRRLQGRQGRGHGGGGDHPHRPGSGALFGPRLCPCSRPYRHSLGRLDNRRANPSSRRRPGRGGTAGFSLAAGLCHLPCSLCRLYSQGEPRADRQGRGKGFRKTQIPQREEKISFRRDRLLFDINCYIVYP